MHSKGEKIVKLCVVSVSIINICMNMKTPMQPLVSDTSDTTVFNDKAFFALI